MNFKIKILIASIFILLLYLYVNAGENKPMQEFDPQKSTKWQMGRFSFILPKELAPKAFSFDFRYCEIIEQFWEIRNDTKDYRLKQFRARLREIQKMERPMNASSAVVEEKDFSTGDKWARGIFYYGDKNDFSTVYWDVLVDLGVFGAWIKVDALLSSKSDMEKLLIDIINHYYVKSESMSKPVFYLRYGAITLPYLEDESFEAFFINQETQDEIRILTDAVYKAEAPGFIDRMANVISSGLASSEGLAIEKLRSGNRKVIDMKGEEVLTKMTNDKSSESMFGWRFPGKDDSGTFPAIEIDLRGKAVNYDSQVKTWDELLNSLERIGL